MSQGKFEQFRRPIGNDLCEFLGQGPVHPRGRMDPIGDSVHRIAGKHLACGRCVPFGNAIDEPGEIEGKPCEVAVLFAGVTMQFALIDEPVEDLLHQRIGEPVMPGTGAQTTTAAVGSVKEAAKSSVPMLGFTVPYAIGNIFLSIGGAIVVAALA